MNFIKKHEFLFFIAGLIFFTPLVLQAMGIIHWLNIDREFLIWPLVIMLALIPSIIWIKVFNAEHHESKTSIILSFIAGATSTIPIFFYQHLFLSDQLVNLIFFKVDFVNFQGNISELFGYPSLSHMTQSLHSGSMAAGIGLFFVFMGVGAMEEVVKQAVVNKKAEKFLLIFAVAAAVLSIYSDPSQANIATVVASLIFYFIFISIMLKKITFRSVDDVIEIGIIAALGFSFMENIHYFMGKWGVISTGAFTMFVVIRVTVVTIVHVLCSGVMAYHIGLAHFAGPVLKEEIREGRKLVIPNLIHKLFDIPEEEAFYYEQMILGIVYAILLHALYDFVMQLQFQVMGIPLFAIIMPIYFIFGLSHLLDLLKRKENQKERGVLVIKKEYE